MSTKKQKAKHKKPSRIRHKNPIMSRKIVRQLIFDNQLSPLQIKEVERFVSQLEEKLKNINLQIIELKKTILEKKNELENQKNIHKNPLKSNSPQPKGLFKINEDFTHRNINRILIPLKKELFLARFEKHDLKSKLYDLIRQYVQSAKSQTELFSNEISEPKSLLF